MNDEPADVDANDAPPVQVSAAEFRAGQVLRSLTPAERTAVQARPRFYSIPWVRLAADPDDDLAF